MSRAPRTLRWSAGFLAALTLTALAVPALPLAAPARPRLERALRGPTLKPLFERHFAVEQLVDPGRVELALATLRVDLLGPWQIGPIWGTDDLGRCLFSRVLWGARPSLLVGTLASLLSLVIGVAYGGVAGLLGGRVDAFAMRGLDVLHSLPLMFLVIFLVTFLRGMRAADPDFPVDQMVVLLVVLGAVSWMLMARLVRSHVRSLVTLPFVDAARVAGSSLGSIALRHLLPNTGPLILVTWTLTVPRVLLLEAYLSFLGLGVEPPAVSFGSLSRQGFDAITAVHVSWWLLVFPSLAMGLTLLALNLLGDALRDRWDPTLRERARSGP